MARRTVRVIRQNLASLSVQHCCQVVVADTFYWVEHRLGEFQDAEQDAWLVFCSPPYAYYGTHSREVLEMLAVLIDRGPDGSLYVVESDAHFDNTLLPAMLPWDVRQYPPATIAICEK